MAEAEPNAEAEKINLKVPKDCASNRYYYRHREKIIQKKLEERMKDAEYVAKLEERRRKKAEKEKKDAEREMKRKLKAAALLNKNGDATIF
jgi:ribosomal protein S4